VGNLRVRFPEAIGGKLGDAGSGELSPVSIRNNSGASMSFTTVAIAGVSSEVGKTTLLCELLREFPGWEAIKMTRGHYRSCGKDPHACCVSHLLGDEPLVRSGFQQTYADDKDTGRYWDAGARNVHWVIVTDDQVERGIQLALERVNAQGVLIEGNSFLRFIDVDFAVLVTGGAHSKIKGSVRWAFQKASAVYLLDQGDTNPQESVELLNTRFGRIGLNRSLPAYAPRDFPILVERIKQAHSAHGHASVAVRV
jgi:molybdopterin-guanine dinucleotide biosynthesis protein